MCPSFVNIGYLDLLGLMCIDLKHRKIQTFLLLGIFKMTETELAHCTVGSGAETECLLKLSSYFHPERRGAI